jgi:hypothetical protein
MQRRIELTAGGAEKKLKKKIKIFLIFFIKFFLHKSKPSQSSCIVPQLITVVGLNIFFIVLKEVHFFKLRLTKHQTNKRYVHQLNIFGVYKMNKRYYYKSNINNYSGTLFFKLRLTNIKQIKDMYIN